MSLNDLVVGNYGVVIELTVQEDGSAADISGFTTLLQMILKHRDGTTATKSASFKTDGTDGIMQCTVADGDLHASGDWQIQGRLVSGSQDVRTVPTSFRVKKQL